MIVSFYDEEFKGLQNNASLSVESRSFKLVKKPIELNELSCTCEAFTEDIQPTFVVIKDNKGGYVYGSLAGVPQINEKNQTEITGTDLKKILSSDILIEPTTQTTVNGYLNYLITTYKNQINQPFDIDFIINANVGTINLTYLTPTTEKRVVDCLEEIQSYLKFYGLFLDSQLDLVDKKVKFYVGKTMYRTLNIKLWEYGIKNYGKWVANTNECKGYYIDNNDTWNATDTWILTKDNSFTTNSALRDIYPIRRKIITNKDSLDQAVVECLTELLDSVYNENIELNATEIKPDFETDFAVYLKAGDATPYKHLPCGKLEYNDSGLVRFQIGYRYSELKFK